MPQSMLHELYRLSSLYHAGSPEISDHAYDGLVIEYKAKGGDPDLLPLDGPPTGFAKAKHRTLMGSLDNAFDDAEFDAFCARAARSLGIQVDDLEFYLEPKIDGASLELCYNDGELLYALTRGNGVVGDIVTANALKISGIPKQIPLSPETEGFLEIRGEVVMFEYDFHKINFALKDRYKNARNLASGSLRVKNPSVLDWRPLHFIAHSLGAMPEPLRNKPTWDEIIFSVSRMGFKIVPLSDKTETGPNFKAKSAYASLKNPDLALLPYAIDGVVAKINNMAQVKRLGMGTRTPYWAIALKSRESDSANTVLKSVTIQVGRTGALTPVAELEPVDVGGVTISRATLHNQDEIDRLGVRVGDLVSVRRAGEVIPEVFAVAERRGNEVYEMPRTCPSCGSQSTRVDGEAVTYCPNESCPERRIQGLIHFVGKDGLDIKGLGESVVRKIVAARLCGSLYPGMEDWPDASGPWLDPSNLLSLRAGDFAKLPSTGEGTAKKLEDAIHHAVRNIMKDHDLAAFIRCLGIRYVATGTSKRLAAAFRSMSDVMNASVDDFLAIPDIGDTTATSLRNFFVDKGNRQSIYNMMSLGLNPKAKEKAEGPLSGKTVLFTGTLSMPRKQAEKMAEAAGASIAGSVSKNLSILVVGTDAGSKLEKARKLGVVTMEEGEFFDICKEDA